ncbi:MAG: zinc ribbon domain-containing protein [Clostridia bacterium]|nr:zinc ribbon domain-containing protein [Clostridia bacterium]
MKCPQCGQWNKASFPVCQKCGTPLDHHTAPAEPSWRGKLKDDQRGKEYIRVNEQGEAETTPDPRDILAREMSELKVRKAQGRERQRQLRQEGAQRGAAPTARTVRVNDGSERFWDPTDEEQMTHIHPTLDPVAGDTYQANRDFAFEHVDDTGRVYNPMWNNSEYTGTMSLPPLQQTKQINLKLPSRKRGLRRLLHVLVTLLIILLVALTGYFGYHYFTDRQATRREESSAIITPSLKDELAAHTVMIPGEDGTQIYIRELHTSYIVTGGFATIEIADHLWYDDKEDMLGDTMTVTLTPFVKTASGQQKPLDLITYDIDIPLSPITLESPDSLRTDVATTMYTMRFTVRPGSKVTINGEDVSDTVSSESGSLSYNATVQPIGDNVFDVVVRSQYCRENLMRVVLYRAPQEIPLDLAADTYSSTSSKVMKVSATTLPGTRVEVLTPHSDLDITNIDTTGAFSFYAIFDHIGYNTISLTSSVPGKETSTINYQVYYLPPASEYTPKAWKLNAEGYAELLSNLQVRIERTQIYVVMGVVQYEVSSKPQMVVINTSEDGLGQPVLVENYTNKTWEVGKYYRIYADAYSSYNNMPWLAGRYSYTN